MSTQVLTMLEADGRRIEIVRLTKAYARRQRDHLLALHNLIPYVEWSEHDLMADSGPDGRPFWGRWQMSLVARVRGRPVGLLVTYLRTPEDRHPLESAYIHRLAVAETWQRRGVGTGLMHAAVNWYFRQLPWLLTVTSQTNDEASNQGVLDFYTAMSFTPTYAVIYPDKRDILLEIERDHGPPPRTHEIDSGHSIDVSGTPFAARPRWEAPRVYFGSSSREKINQYRHLMRCHGLQLRRLRTVVSLVEPQVEGHGAEHERALVAEPLKWFSRFAARSGTYPVVIEDTMLVIEHFNRDFQSDPILPGADTKRWWQALGAQGVLDLMQGSSRRRARYICQLGTTTGPGEYRTFRAEQEGTIATAVRASATGRTGFPLSNATFFHQIFVPDGEERTLAELAPHEFVLYDYRRRCLSDAASFLHASARRPGQAELFAPDT